MRKFFPALMILVLSFAQSAAGQQIAQAAGIIAVACKGNTALYLLARERSSPLP